MARPASWVLGLLLSPARKVVAARVPSLAELDTYTPQALAATCGLLKASCCSRTEGHFCNARVTADRVQSAVTAQQIFV